MRAVVTGDGVLAMAGQRFRCALGKSGVIAAARKQEGDGATPAAAMALRRVLYRADRLHAPDCAVAVEPIGPADGWCDAPDDSMYNRMVSLPYGARHEALWRADGLYDIVGVLGWNDAPVRRAAGSAIFLHVATADYAPTEGCVALAPADLRRVLTMGLTEIHVAG
jgi:L,D-peptidoglycan transpeptidase YkuD (ErfK/YbiS/YcfS/YnhG family)